MGGNAQGEASGWGGEPRGQGGRGDDGAQALAEIQDGILDRLHAGEVLDRAGILAAHPQHAEALRRFFDLVEVIEAPPSPAGMAPSRLGEFEILREIGRGGMGVVYAARQASLNRTVALKVLPPALRRDERLHARFRREAEAAGRLRHPNIVPVYSIGESAGAPFFTMELVEGRSLADVIRTRRAGESAGLPPAGDGWRRWVIETLARVGDALAYAHGRGILHRDVKPANILLEQDGTPRLTDFGLALDLQASELTLTGEIFGSPLYMSPEQAFRREQPVDARSDVYSLAVTLYEALTLHLPYAGSTQADLLSALSDGLIVPPREVDPAMPEALERVLLRALRRDPLERYANIAEFAADLRLALENPDAVSTPRPRGFGRQRSFDKKFTGVGFVWLWKPKSKAARAALAQAAARSEGGSASTAHGPVRRWRERHPFYHGLVVSLVLAGICLAVVLILTDRAFTSRRDVALQPRIVGVAGSQAITRDVLELLAEGRAEDGATRLAEWLRPEFHARSVVSRSEPSFVEFGFSAAPLWQPSRFWRLPDDVGSAPGHPVLSWKPGLEVNGKSLDDSLHGDVLSIPEDFVGGAWRYARFGLDQVLGEAAKLDAVTVTPSITFVIGRAGADASLPPAPAPPEGAASAGSVAPTPEPQGGTRWVWKGAPQTLFLYDSYPADYPRAVSDAATTETMLRLCEPTSLKYSGGKGGSTSRELYVVLGFEHVGDRPVAGAFQAELLLPGSERVLAHATLVLPATVPGEHTALMSFGLPFELDGPPSEEEQQLLFLLQGDRGQAVHVRLRGSRDVALREPGLDSYWDGTVEVDVPVRRPGDSR